ncbi:GtrA family protein [Sphingosinicella terrae]|uniref:GtrA family protein n=1 Tax=Sphingosinicella terrae TaxID=2172047 RepID=UPI000E0D6198|nr:GtrA family protein [Sphingosinicella terrae]
MSSDAGRLVEAGAKLAESRGARLFGRNTIASFLAFGIDLALLWTLVEVAGIGRLPAAAAAFLLAMSVHYVVSRLWVFKGSRRGMASGYLYFLVNAGIGLVVTLAVFWSLIDLLEIQYLIARLIASVVAGLLVFFLNAAFNFKAI